MPICRHQRRERTCCCKAEFNRRTVSRSRSLACSPLSFERDLRLIVVIMKQVVAIIDSRKAAACSWNQAHYIPVYLPISRESSSGTRDRLLVYKLCQGHDVVGKQSGDAKLPDTMSTSAQFLMLTARVGKESSRRRRTRALAGMLLDPAFQPL